MAGVYEVGADGVLADVKGSGGISPVGAPLDTRKRESVYGVSWYNNIVSDMFT